MKNIYRHLLVFLIIVFSLALCGCNNVQAEESTEVTETVTISAEEKEAYRQRREDFDKLAKIIFEERDSIITEFLLDPVDPYNLIQKLRENEENFVILWDSVKNLSPEDYAEISKLFETYQIHDGLSIVLYHEIGEKPYAYYEFGTYTIKDLNNVEIVWSQNVEVYREAEKEITYKVSDLYEDAFLILKDCNGYWLVEIASTFKEDIYTKGMFDEYYEFLENQKEKILSDFSKNPVITEDLLQKLYINEAGYSRLLESAKSLPNDIYSRVMLIVELNQWNDGIHTVAYDKKYYQKYYHYADGEFFVSSESAMKILWTQNFEEVEEDDCYNSIYKVKEKKEDSYLLLDRGGTLQLFRITSLKQK